MTQIEKIRNLIGEDELLQAIRLLKDLVGAHPILDSVIIQQGNLTDVEKEIIRGTIDPQEIRLRKNQIRSSLLKILRIIEDTATTNEEVNKIISNISIGNQFEFTPNLSEWVRTSRGLKIVMFSLGIAVLYLIVLSINIFSTEGVVSKPSSYGVIIQFLFIAFAAIQARKYKELDTETKDKKLFVDERSFWDKLRLHRRTEQSPESEEEQKLYVTRFKNGANKAINQFVFFWFCFWATWLAFGLVAFCKHTIGSEEMIFYKNLENLFNNLNTLMLIYLYLNITISTSRIPEAAWIIFAVVISILSFMEPLTLSTMTDDTQKYYTEFGIKAVIGFISGLTLMAFLGRLGGKFMNIPIPIMLLLYVYVFYQLIFPLWDYSLINVVNVEHDKMNLTFEIKNLYFYSSFFSLFFKMILFVTITWLLDSGKMLYFIAEESSLNFKQDDDFKKFLYAVPMKERKIF